MPSSKRNINEPYTTKVRFIRHNRFENFLFVCTPEIDEKGYEKLCELSDSLKRNFADQYHNVHQVENKDICYIQTMKYPKEMLASEYYNLSWKPVLRTKKDKPNEHYVAIKAFNIEHIQQAVEEYQF